jgi:hypothetical protein
MAILAVCDTALAFIPRYPEGRPRVLRGFVSEAISFANDVFFFAGPPLDLPQDITSEQLQILLNQLLNQEDDRLPYSFFVQEQEVTVCCCCLYCACCPSAPCPHWTGINPPIQSA